MHKPNPDTIARLLNQAGEHLKSAIPAPGVTDGGPSGGIDAAMRCIHQAFQESIGGAAYARPEPDGPWVVKTCYGWEDCDNTNTAILADARRFDTYASAEGAASAWPATSCATVITLAKAQWMEGEAKPEPSPRPAAPAQCGHCTRIDSVPTACSLPPGHDGAHSDGDDEWCGPKPAAPAAVAGWVVRATYVCVDGKDGGTVYASNANTGHTSSIHLAHRFPSRDGLLERERLKWGSYWRVDALPVDAAGNVLEERAEPAPAPREPDGWMAVDDRGRCSGAWTRGEFTDPEKRAKSVAGKWGHEYTAHPFWFDSPPVHPSSLTDVVTALEDERNTLRAEVERLRVALRAIAATCGGGIHETATTDLHCMVADEARLVVERLTRDRDEAREERDAARAHAAEVEALRADRLVLMAQRDAAREAAKVSEENANHWCGRCLDAETQRDSALALARRCRDVALGERERIEVVLNAYGWPSAAQIATNLPAPTLPEVP